MMTTGTIEWKRTRKINEIDKFELFEYRPSLLKPLLINFEPMKFVRRCRYFLEYLYPNHYLVYYLSHNGKMVAHCVVCPGGRKLKCTTKEDIVLGPYFVMKEERGKGYSKVIIKMVLENYRYSYMYAYDYIAKTNTPSIKASEKCGFKPFSELNIQGIMRTPIIVSQDGDYIVFRFKKES